MTAKTVLPSLLQEGKLMSKAAQGCGLRGIAHSELRKTGFSATLMGALAPYFSSCGHVGGAASLPREVSCRDC